MALPRAPPTSPPWTWRALRKAWRGRRGVPTNPLPILVPLAGSLFCFVQVFLSLDAVTPASAAVEALGGTAGGGIGQGFAASAWFVAGAALLGLAGAAPGTPWSPRVRLRKSPPPRAHVTDPPAPAPPRTIRPPPVGRVTAEDVIGALVKPPRRSATAVTPSRGAEEDAAQVLGAWARLAEATTGVPR